MAKTKKWGKKFKDKRNWKVYHEELITRGESFIDLNYLVWVLYPDACIGLIRKLNTKNTPQLAAIGIFYFISYLYSLNSFGLAISA